MKRLIATVACALGVWLAPSTRAQTADPLPDYASLLPQVKAKSPVIDRQKGYVVEELKPNVFMITEGAYESAFVTTGRVVLFDAPPSFAHHLQQAVSEKTSEPIVELVYTHVHVDHIGGAGLVLKQNPKVEILAEMGTAEFLREMHDPHRPVPTRTFKDHETLKLGSLTANIKVGYWHSPEGDLLISIPDKKFVIAIDAFSAGSSPFMGFDLTMNMHEYLKLFDQLQSMDFDVMVPGHHSTPATHEDVQISKTYVTDVYRAEIWIGKWLGRCERPHRQRSQRMRERNQRALDHEIRGCGYMGSESLPHCSRLRAVGCRHPLRSLGEEPTPTIETLGFRFRSQITST